MINYENFILFPQDVKKDSHFHFSDITYDIDLEDRMVNYKGAIVLYYSDMYDNLVELQTKGDGSCLFYATETIDSIEHQMRKLKLLRVNIRLCFEVLSLEQSILTDFIQFTNETEVNNLNDCVIKKYINDINWTIDEYKIYLSLLLMKRLS